MWNKVYIALLGLSVLLVGFFVYYSWSWLQSIGDPRAAVAGFEYHAGIGSFILWITTLILLLIANAVFARSRSPWALWCTFVYFSIFVLIKFFWLGTAESSFRTENRLEHSSSFLGPIVAVLLCGGFGLIVFANHFIAARIIERIYPTAPEPEIANESNNEENPVADDVEE